MRRKLTGEELEKQQQKYEEALLEQHEKDEQEYHEIIAENRIHMVLDEFKKSSEDTLKDNKHNIVLISHRLESFTGGYDRHVDIRGGAAVAVIHKFPEMLDCAEDSLYLSVCGRYKTAYILMRKLLELFAVAVYIDSKNISKDPKSQSWIYESGDSPIRKTNAIKEIDQGQDEKLFKLYKKLCAFTHNEGGEKYQLILPCYDKEAFEGYVKDMLFLLETLTEILTKRPSG